MAALRDKIRDKTQWTCGDSLASVVASLNPLLQGWFGYFQHAHPYTFSPIDGFVRRRLRAVLRRRWLLEGLIVASNSSQMPVLRGFRVRVVDPLRFRNRE
jgi:Group II intron, maturase-specific domain